MYRYFRVLAHLSAECTLFQAIPSITIRTVQYHTRRTKKIRIDSGSGTCSPVVVSYRTRSVIWIGICQRERAEICSEILRNLFAVFVSRSGKGTLDFTAHGKFLAN